MQSKSFAANIRKGISSRIRSLFYNPYKEAGIGKIGHIYLKHLPAGKLRKHKMYGGYFYYYRPAELLHGIKEIFVDKLYEQDIPGQPYIIDCGANVGLSVIFLKTKFPDATIVAYEPDEQNFTLLSKNVASYRLDKVQLKKEAVWIENTYLNFSNDGTMSSKIEESAKPGIVQVKAIRLKDVINQPVDFLKIDIEGAEYAVLKDIEEKLPLVKNLFIEYHGTYSQNKELSEIFSILTGSGFHYYIKEAAEVYKTPFIQKKDENFPFDIQLNIFCFRN